MEVAVKTSVDPVDSPDHGDGIEKGVDELIE